MADNDSKVPLPNLEDGEPPTPADQVVAVTGDSAANGHWPRSALMISVMVTPSFSSTSTTSPRATSRLLT